MISKTKRKGRAKPAEPTIVQFSRQPGPGMFANGPGSIAVGDPTEFAEALFGKKIAEPEPTAAGPDVPAWKPDRPEPGALSAGDDWQDPEDARIIPQKWIAPGGLWAGVTQVGGGDFQGCMFTRNGERMGTILELTPRPGFRSAQRDLDFHAAEKNWMPATVIPADDPKPKPTRRAAKEAKERTPTSVVVAAPLATPLEIGLIDPSPYQPRQEFDAEAIASLAQSIEAHGVLQPILVRPSPTKAGRYELVAGERRLRAAKAAKLATIPAVVRQLDDHAAEECCLMENLQREDLDAIEKARAYRAMLARPGQTQAALAQRLGVSQPKIANQLRLLELPDEALKLIQKGTLPPTHARSLATYKESPELVRAILKEVDFKNLPTKEAFERDVMGESLRLTKDMTGTVWDTKHYRDVPVFKPTAEQSEALKIVQIKDWTGKMKPRALNTRLWNELQAAHAKQWIEAHPEARSNGRSTKPSKEEIAKMKPAAAKAAQEKADAERRAQQVKQTRARVWTWLHAYLRKQIIVKLTADRSPALRIWVYLATCERTCHERDQSLRANVFGELLKGRGVKVRTHSDGYRSSPDVWDGIEQIGSGEFVAAAVDLLKSCLDPASGMPIPDKDVEAIAKSLGVDLAAAWKADAKGEAGREFLELHTREQIQAMAQDLKEFIGDGPKGALISILQGRTKFQILPKALAKPKR